MKKITRILSLFLVVLILYANFNVPVARSVLYDYDKASDNLILENLININVKVIEEVNMGSKSNVKIQNTSNTKCFVKATVIFTAVNTNGEILPEIQLSYKDGKIKDVTDSSSEKEVADITWGNIYTSDLSSKSKCWIEYKSLSSSATSGAISGTYLYENALNKKAITSNLINSITINNELTDYNLKVEIITDAIFANENTSLSNIKNSTDEINSWIYA